MLGLTLSLCCLSRRHLNTQPKTMKTAGREKTHSLTGRVPEGEERREYGKVTCSQIHWDQYCVHTSIFGHLRFIACDHLYKI